VGYDGLGPKLPDGLEDLGRVVLVVGYYVADAFPIALKQAGGELHQELDQVLVVNVGRPDDVCYGLGPLDEEAEGVVFWGSIPIELTDVSGVLPPLKSPAELPHRWYDLERINIKARSMERTG